MKLYYSPGACSLSDHIVLEWIGEPYEAVRLSREDRQTPEYLAINPAGAVPALALDGWVLTQNTAILNYLADTHPEAGLVGDGSARSRAEVNRWLGIANSDIHPAFHPLFGATGYLEDPVVIDKTKQAAATKLRSLFARVDKQLEGRDWITGHRSIADAYLFVVTRWTRSTHVDISAFANLQAHQARIAARPAVQEALKAEGLPAK